MQEPQPTGGGQFLDRRAHGGQPRAPPGEPQRITETHYRQVVGYRDALFAEHFEHAQGGMNGAHDDGRGFLPAAQQFTRRLHAERPGRFAEHFDGLPPVDAHVGEGAMEAG
ncbi:hypothetical protein D3C81_1009910 [compost metagenome]